MNPTVARTAAIVVLVLGCAVMVYRGPVRALTHGSYDAALVYAGARAWLEGGNPYTAESVSRAWMSGGGAAERDPMKSRTREVLVYPPPALAVMSAWAWLPYSAASVVWVFLNVGMMVVAVVGAASVAGLERGETKWWWAMAAGAWLAPFHTSIAHGQTAVLVAACVVGGVLARARGRGALGGMLLGIGAAVKPQLAGLFLVYEAGRMRWRVVAFGAAAVAVVSAAAVLRMEVGDGSSWRQAWLQNIGDFAIGGDGRPTRDNPLRMHLVNLHYPLHTFVYSVSAVKWMVYGLVGMLCAAYAWVDWRARRAGRAERGAEELVSLSMVAVATLLVVYHRFYDATVLVLVAAMVVRQSGWRRWAPLVLIAPFFFNSGVVVGELTRTGRVPEGVSGSWVWEGVAMPHSVWALVVLGVLLIAARADRTRSREAS